MSGLVFGAKVAAWLASSSTTITKHTSAAPSLPLSKDMTAGSATKARSPPAPPWVVEAASEADALELLPFYVAERATVSQVSEVQIP